MCDIRNYKQDYTVMVEHMNKHNQQHLWWQNEVADSLCQWSSTFVAWRPGRGRGQPGHLNSRPAHTCCQVELCAICTHAGPLLPLVQMFPHVCGNCRSSIMVLNQLGGWGSMSMWKILSLFYYLDLNLIDVFVLSCFPWVYWNCKYSQWRALLCF